MKPLTKEKINKFVDLAIKIYKTAIYIDEGEKIRYSIRGAIHEAYYQGGFCYDDEFPAMFDENEDIKPENGIYGEVEFCMKRRLGAD